MRSLAFVAGLLLAGTLFASIAPPAEAASISWTVHFNAGCADEWASGVAIDAGSAAYVSGSYDSCINSVWDGVVVKWNGDGSFEWFHVISSELGPNFEGYDDYARGITFAADSAYVVGTTLGTLPSGGGSSGGKDAFVMKIWEDNSGGWTRQFGTSLDDEAYGVAADETGVYVVGFTAGTLGQYPSGGIDAFIRKYNHAGEVLWTVQFGTVADDWAFGISYAGALFVTGQTMGTFPQQTSAGGRDAFVARFDLLGDPTWVRQFGTAGHDEVPVGGAISGGDPGAAYAAVRAPEEPSDPNSPLDSTIRRFNVVGNETSSVRLDGSVEAVAADATGVSVIGNDLIVPGFLGQVTPTFVRRYDLEGKLEWTVGWGLSLASLESLRAGAGSPQTGLFVGGRFVDVIQGTTEIGLARVQMNDTPNALFDFFPDPPKVGQPVEFDASGSTDPEGDQLTYDWDFGDTGTGTGVQITHAFLAYGSYTVTLTVSDGLTSDTYSLGMSIVNDRPTACFSMAPESPRYGETISFDASCSSDPNGDALTYTWNFGDGPPVPGGVRTSHLYGMNGAFTISLTVSDGLLDSLPFPRSVSFGGPTARFDWFPDSPRVGQAVEFDAGESSDPNGDQLVYTWNFGDDPVDPGTASGVWVTHAFQSTGVFDVVLTVSDGSSPSGTETHQVTVALTPTAGIVVDLSGELDYGLNEVIELQFFAVVRDAQDGAYISSATLVLEIYNPTGAPGPWPGTLPMTELTPGIPGVYNWRAGGPIRVTDFGKGIWHARVLAQYGSFLSVDVVQFHADPPGDLAGDGESWIPWGVASTAVVLAVFATAIWNRNRIRKGLGPRWPRV